MTPLSSIDFISITCDNCLSAITMMQSALFTQVKCSSRLTVHRTSALMNQSNTNGVAVGGTGAGVLLRRRSVTVLSAYFVNLIFFVVCYYFFACFINVTSRMILEMVKLMNLDFKLQVIVTHGQ